MAPTPASLLIERQLPEAPLPRSAGAYEVLGSAAEGCCRVLMSARALDSPFSVDSDLSCVQASFVSPSLPLILARWPSQSLAIRLFHCQNTIRCSQEVGGHLPTIYRNSQRTCVARRLVWLPLKPQLCLDHNPPRIGEKHPKRDQRPRAASPAFPAELELELELGLALAREPLEAKRNTTLYGKGKSGGQAALLLCRLSCKHFCPFAASGRSASS